MCSSDLAVSQWLHFLKRHHVCYRNISISEENLSSLPENGNVFDCIRQVDGGLQTGSGRAARQQTESTRNSTNQARGSDGSDGNTSGEASEEEPDEHDFVDVVQESILPVHTGQPSEQEMIRFALGLAEASEMSWPSQQSQEIGRAHV